MSAAEKDVIGARSARPAEFPATRIPAAPSAAPLTQGAAAPAPSARPATAAAPGGVRLRWPLIWTVVVVALLYWGSHAHLERFITPRRGLGYWLGITGGSMMLMLLLYSARKRYRWLGWMGKIPAWFRIHMTLGVVGPVLILFHANFRLGATNSNVALISMLIVAGSGVIGRYVYTRLHARLDGKEESLEELKETGERLRSQASSIEFFPGLIDAIETIEKRLIERPKGLAAGATHLLTAPVRMARARYLIRREIRLALRRARLRESQVIARNAERLALVVRRYAYRRFDAGRRVTEYQAYEQIFSLWHVLHIPLFFMLLIAGIVHVVAVNLY
ncbi:MAG: pyridine nucleotide-disulfide oxidoreductase [Gammaproteobacteria bacterium]|nr:pyridine nucleotide-disulfide oxidoreductase [Gammaproteobacteria bacterium]